jgi:mannose-6-phosphate isomerase-like protein (cupin superfamily)
MKRKHLRFGKGFRVAINAESSQAAEMTLAPGESEGGSDNRHRGSDQWLFVVAGSGKATINGRAYPLKPGTLVLIERGDTHKVENTGRAPLKTLNFYVPPAYTTDGNELPRGRK